LGKEKLREKLHGSGPENQPEKKVEYDRMNLFADF
jgi:hypothetical protein